MNIRKINHGRVNTVEANYKKQSKFKKANPIVWFIFLVFSRLIMKIKGRIKWDNKELKKRNKKDIYN